MYKKQLEDDKIELESAIKENFDESFSQVSFEGSRGDQRESLPILNNYGTDNAINGQRDLILNL